MAAKKNIHLNSDESSVTFENLTLQLHPTIFQYLSDTKKVKVGEQQSVLEKALNVGILAALQGRVYETVKLFNSELSGEYSLLSTHMEVLAASPGMSRRRDIGIGVNMWTGLTLQLEMHRRLESQPHSRSSSECVRG